VASGDVTGARDDRSRDAVCPVCDAPGTENALWTHLAQEHGWPEARIRERLGPHPYAEGEADADPDGD
jgi:hypothetical protein